MASLVPTSPAALEIAPETVEKVLLQGDLSQLKPAERLNYYNAVCQSLNLNPLTRPFDYITFKGKTVLYAKRECTEQLRRLYNVSVTIKSREITDGCYVVTAGASLPNGRTDECIGAITLDNLKGEDRANAMMKAETKAKRRVTLAICGMAFLDETEVETIPNAKVYDEMRHAADARQAARKAAEQAVSEGTHYVLVDPDGPIPEPPDGLLPPHDEQLRASVEPLRKDIKDFGVRPTKKSPDKIQLMKAFAGVKKLFKEIAREDAYYRTLGAYGAVHSSDFPDTPGGIKQGRECYKEMSLAYGEAKAEEAKKQEQPACVVDDDVPF